MTSILIKHITLSGALILLALSSHAAPDPNSADLSFGIATGSSGNYRPVYAQPRSPGAEWGGGVKIGCGGIDFKSFTDSFKPQALIRMIADNYITGFQKAAVDYLVGLNTANPQLAASINIQDKAMDARYKSFGALCRAVEAKRNSADEVERRAAEAKSECFFVQIQGGAVPEDALRLCDNPRSYGGLGIPSEKVNIRFLTDHTHMPMSGDITNLLTLLPDKKMTSSGVQINPPIKSITQVNSKIETMVKDALDAVMAGARAVDIAECTSPQMIADMPAPNGCVPPQALGLVRSDAFLAARALPPAQQSMYTSALAEQIAAMTTRSFVQDLSQAIDTMGAKDVDAAAATQRQTQLRGDVQRLADDANKLSKISEERANIARINLLAVRQAEAITKRNADKYSNLSPTAQKNSFAQKLAGFLNP
jgi:hypothetical protein